MVDIGEIVYYTGNKGLDVPDYDERLMDIVLEVGKRYQVIGIRVDDFYILDNGYLTRKVVKASSYFFKNEKVRPIVGFNVGNQWSYK